MIENARVQGDYLRAGLTSIGGSVIGVRGRGLMLAVDIHPDAGTARDACDALRQQGILAKDTHGQTVRISPPLILTRDQADWALGRFSVIGR